MTTITVSPEELDAFTAALRTTGTTGISVSDLMIGGVVYGHHVNYEGEGDRWDRAGVQVITILDDDETMEYTREQEAA